MAIGVIDILIRANKSKFSKTVKGVVGELAGMSASIVKIAAGTGLAVGAAGAAGLTAVTASSLQTIDDVGKMSDVLGIATEKLTGLNHAANLAGVDAEEFSGAIKKMNVNIANAAVNGGGATDALKTIGLSAKDLVGLNPDEAFLKISDGLKGVENTSQRAALAQEIFGKKGQQLIPLMLGGSDAIKQAQVEAEKLGLTYSRVDAANVEEANDAWSRVWGIFTGIGNTIAVAVAPYLKAVADSIMAFALSGDGLKANVGSALEWLGTKLIDLMKYMVNMEVIFWNVAKNITWAVKQIIDYPVAALEWAFNKLAKALGFEGVHITDGASKMLDEMVKKLEDVEKAALNGQGAIGSSIKFLEDVQKKAAAANVEMLGPPKPKEIAGVNKSAVEDKEREKRIADGKKEYQDYLKTLRDEAKQVIDATKTPLEKLQEEMEHLQMLKENGLLTDEQFNRASAKASKEFQGGFSKEGASTANVLEAGTTAAFDAINNRNESMEKPLNELVDLAKQQLEETKKKDSKSAEEVLSIL